MARTACAESRRWRDGECRRVDAVPDMAVTKKGAGGCFDVAPFRPFPLERSVKPDGQFQGPGAWFSFCVDLPPWSNPKLGSEPLLPLSKPAGRRDTDPQAVRAPHEFPRQPDRARVWWRSFESLHQFKGCNEFRQRVTLGSAQTAHYRQLRRIGDMGAIPGSGNRGPSPIVRPLLFYAASIAAPFVETPPSLTQVEFQSPNARSTGVD